VTDFAETRFKIARAQGKNVTRQDGLFALIAALLTALALHHLHAVLLKNNSDISVFYLPWYEHIVRYGRWSSLEGSFANYSPPYLYIVSFVSLFAGTTSPVIMVKLAQVPGLLVGAWMFWSICRKLGCSQTRSLLAAWMLLVAPEVFWNTLLWGQCDMIHTACILVMARLLLARRPAWAMVALGVALAFKLQAIFVGATIAALFLSSEVPLWSAVCVPAGYLVMMVPAWLAGRPWSELLLVYQSQYQSQPEIAKHVANPYQLIFHFTELHPLAYRIAMPLGFLAAGAATVGLVAFLTRSPWRLRGMHLLVAIAFTLLMEPFFLPKMHDRYFFSGDVIVLLLAMIKPRLAVPAAMLQIAALITYAPELIYPHLPGHEIDEPTLYYLPAVLLVLVSLVWIGWTMWKPADEAVQPTIAPAGPASE
jgi:Gpi18-like mannosyltransferase